MKLSVKRDKLSDRVEPRNLEVKTTMDYKKGSP